jgi:ribosomal protein S18 acetylase RimI-like enzyme
MEFTIEKAKPQDADAIADVIRQVYEAMEHKEWYVADNAEYTSRILSTGAGIGYLAREKESGAIAGILLVTIPGDAPENLGNDIGFTLEQRLATAHMESAAVLDAYRGNHLQYRLMQTAEAELAREGWRYLMCTVHPENRFSRGNVERQGYRLMKIKEKYGGCLRGIFLKELTCAE